ncbi:Cu(I)-responsive transcriptional regulator [Actinobacillus succinogenes]|uniref:HTH-type transcriptional regulator CueR n=1 Tax=Actinobacillus succinogenes (strain ATCC 55618 / DSM 22257 / CCUG 43843 / 130Z) TaxID=339671 RepID=A6VN52_ACTSZ|nr:Cu(I)-responsive transcriptional regulator [Actinobacillus succinogenes]ABR74399.1 putative transcriptional regulator, MerR family [Actinobacillus succinogenes 130Z]PHI39180.1 Cu(I)-responsive transcriptional regulator [Actinobacillus succinogenes]
MNITEVAQKTQLTQKSIRFYEEKGLITPPTRGVNGYRQYNASHIEELTLIHQARQVGFSLPVCKELLELYKNPHRRSADVKARTMTRIAEIDTQIRQLQFMREKLMSLAQQCPGDDSENCPIINGLSCPHCG